jgi:hypothetical protein
MYISQLLVLFPLDCFGEAKDVGALACNCVVFEDAVRAQEVDRVPELKRRAIAPRVSVTKLPFFSPYACFRVEMTDFACEIPVKD